MLRGFADWMLKRVNDGGRMLHGAAETMAAELFSLLLRVASGKETRNEQTGYREIAIFKDEVTL